MMIATWRGAAGLAVALAADGICASDIRLDLRP
jgi:hypothetical protein